jgi:hypothetical protein
MSDGFSFVVTAEHGGDSNIILTKAELVTLRQKLTQIFGNYDWFSI